MANADRFKGLFSGIEKTKPVACVVKVMFLKLDCGRLRPEESLSKQDLSDLATYIV